MESSKDKNNQVDDSSDDSSDDNDNTWERADDIPRRFDELPPEPDWIPVADIIRQQRKAEAKAEAEKIKIKPPPSKLTDASPDSWSANRETPLKRDVKKYEARKIETPRTETRGKPTLTPIAVKDEDDAEIDEVSKSMLDWGLDTNYEPKKKKKGRRDTPDVPPMTSVNHDKASYPKKSTSHLKKGSLYPETWPEENLSQSDDDEDSDNSLQTDRSERKRTKDPARKHRPTTSPRSSTSHYYEDDSPPRSGGYHRDERRIDSPHGRSRHHHSGRSLPAEPTGHDSPRHGRPRDYPKHHHGRLRDPSPDYDNSDDEDPYDRREHGRHYDYREPSRRHYNHHDSPPHHRHHPRGPTADPEDHYYDNFNDLYDKPRTEEYCGHPDTENRHGQPPHDYYDEPDPRHHRRHYREKDEYAKHFVGHQDYGHNYRY